MTTSSPLSDQEFDELARLLASSANGEDAMDISMLDGFLTALSIGPNPLPLKQWMLAIWGGPTLWESRQQAEYIASLVFRHAQDIQNRLLNHAQAFKPYLYEMTQDEEKMPIIDEWCVGFVKGIALDEESWKPFMESEVGRDLLYPIILFGTESGWLELKRSPELYGHRALFATVLTDIVVAIRAWWLPRRKAKHITASQILIANAAFDNDCPCGRKIGNCHCEIRTMH